MTQCRQLRTQRRIDNKWPIDDRVRWATNRKNAANCKQRHMVIDATRLVPYDAVLHHKVAAWQPSWLEQDRANDDADEGGAARKLPRNLGATTFKNVSHQLRRQPVHVFTTTRPDCTT
jgi:hypothetical protein